MLGYCLGAKLRGLLMEILDAIYDYFAPSLPEATDPEVVSKEGIVEQICKKYLKNPFLEFDRLCDSGVINWEKESLLDKAIEPLTSIYEFDKKLEIKVMIGRALEIQKIYQETHDVFIHAQASSGIVFPSLVKEFMKIQHTDQNFHDFEFLRLPNSSTTPSITAYSKSFSVDDHEEQTREDLISADGYFYHNEGGESSLYFMAKNSSIMSMTSTLLAKAIRYFHPSLSEESVNLFSKQVSDLTNADPSHIGNLFVFCLPKEKSKEIQYRAHPFGKPCDCHSEEESTEVLEKLQSGILDEETKCSDDWGWTTWPQFRLFTPELTQENGVKIHFIPSDLDFQENVQQKVRDIALVIEAIDPVGCFAKIAC